MLLVDEAEFEDGVSHGKIHIRGDEWFLQGGIFPAIRWFPA